MSKAVERFLGWPCQASIDAARFGIGMATHSLRKSCPLMAHPQIPQDKSLDPPKQTSASAELKTCLTEEGVENWNCSHVLGAGA